ncbi:MAG: hypothetical protein H9Q65_03570 [Spiroplasma ixodetis]|nr:hypothetical protein [Spiroplasma ixodetis]MBP1526858.1 hypothetical protein [Spiroplasma ixodetis]MBP1528315.1 hypothetical protein [Spiroplasma ixodetis]
MDNENKKQKDNKKLETKLNSWKEDLKLQKEKALVLKQKSELTPSTSKETKNLIEEQIKSINELETTANNAIEKFKQNITL